MDTQTQIERLIELAIIQRSELKRLVDELPQLREHLSSEIEKTFEDAEPQLRAELEEFIEKRATDATAKTGAALEAKIKELSSNLEISTQARFNAIIAEREQNARLAAEAEAKIAEHAASLPSAVKDIVTAELARFPRAGEIDQLRKEFAEPRGLNPRGKWQAGETYNKLDLVTINGDSYTSNTDGNRTRPSRSSADWTLVAARGTGGGGGPTSLTELTTVPSDGDLLIGSGTSWVTSNLTAGAGISITVGPGAITISATDGDITLDDGTAASPSLHFTNDPDTGIYRPAANTLGISVSGTQIAYFDENGLTVPSAGVVAGGSFHGANGNANNPSFSFTSDQDTGFYRHGTNELGISIGGTEKAVMTSTTFTITPNLVASGTTTMTGAASGSTLSLSGNATVADTILGSSGPSVKSSLSARAPRQGLVFDGSSTSVGTVSIPAYGQSALTISGWAVWTGAQQGVILDGTNSIVAYVNGAGSFRIYSRPASADLVTTADGTIVANKWFHWAYNRDKIYINGVAASASAGDTQNYTGGTTSIGQNVFSADRWIGAISGPFIYNRALSASEVVALYEAGAPAGADYNSASNTSVVTGFSNGGYTTFSGASATGFTAAAASGSNYVVNTPAGNTQPVLQVGSRVRVSFTATLTSGAAPTFGIRNNVGGDEGTFTVAAGSNSVIITMTQKSVSDGLGNAVFRSTGATSYAISNFSLTYLGLLLAPDAAQAGGGLVWYDTSGNAANITLPASGVSWNVPTSGNWGGNLTVSGRNRLDYNSTVASHSGLWLNQTSPAVGNYSLLSDGTTLYLNVPTGGTLQFRRNNINLGIIDGNFLLGKAINSGNGMVQLADHTTSAGGIGFGTDASLYRYQAGGLALDATNNVPALMLRQSGTNALFAYTSSLIGYIGTPGAYSLNLQTNNTTALTLDSSQNATFAGSVKVNSANGIDINSGGTTAIFSQSVSGVRKNYIYFDGTDTTLGADTGNLKLSPIGTKVIILSGRALQLGNAYVAGAPTATGYVTIQDSAGNTYKVLVGT